MPILKTRIILVLATVLGACQAQSTDRVDHPDDHLSLERIDGWTESRERGSLVLSDPESRATISVRAGEIGTDTPLDLERLTASTTTVLASLPSSRVEGPVPLDHPALAGALFEVSFVPPGRNEPYARRHGVLVGEHHFYHVMLTAPEAQLASASDQFLETVSSLREE